MSQLVLERRFKVLFDVIRSLKRRLLSFSFLTAWKKFWRYDRVMCAGWEVVSELSE